MKLKAYPDSLNFDQLKNAIENNTEISNIENCHLRITVAECDSLLNLVTKIRQKNNSARLKSIQQYDNRRTSKRDYATTAPDVYTRLMNEINTQETSDQRHYDSKDDYLLTIKNVLCQTRAQIKLAQNKLALEDYLDRQIIRLTKIAANSEKLSELQQIKNNTSTIVNPQQFHQLLAEVREKVRHHREQDFFSMFFKFNWLRNTKSLNELNEVFDSNNQINIDLATEYKR